MTTAIKPLEITDANIDQVISGNKPVLIDFWADWCGPCHMIAPVIQELADEYEGKAVVGKLDVDANPVTAQKYGIRSIPTLIITKGGQVVDQQIGVVPKAVIGSKLEAQM